MKVKCWAFSAITVLCFSSHVIADTLHFEFEVTETRKDGKPWDGGLGAWVGAADPAPDIYGIIKLISGESCEVVLQKNSFLAQQDCKFTVEINPSDKISIDLLDKDVGVKDDIIFNGTVTLQDNPTVIGYPNNVDRPPNVFLKSIKVVNKSKPPTTDKSKG
ncbi:MAG: hypothetical protein PHP00_09375 [Thiotrichaceae bacterium]|nr:hypothetical protein [Thiotrichaceae bacterium]